MTVPTQLIALFEAQIIQALTMVIINMLAVYSELTETSFEYVCII